MEFHEEHFRPLQLFSRPHRLRDIGKDVKNVEKDKNLDLYPFAWIFRLIGSRRLTPILSEILRGTFWAATLFSLSLIDCEIFAKN